MASKFIKLMSNNQQPTIYGDGTQSRELTYVANVFKANILAATKVIQSGLVMNGVYHGQIILNEPAAQFANLLHKDDPPRFLDGGNATTQCDRCPSTPLCGASILILRQAPHSGRQDDRSPSMLLVLRMTGVRSLRFDSSINCRDVIHNVFCLFYYSIHFTVNQTHPYPSFPHNLNLDSGAGSSTL